MGDQRIAVPLGHDLALLRNPQTTGHGIGRQRKHCPGGRTAAAAQGPAATVKERHRHVELAGQPGQSLLGVVQPPVSGKVTAVLDAVGVADHADLVSAQGVEVSPVASMREYLTENAFGTPQIVDGLQQGHDRQRHVRHMLAGGAQPAQPEHRQYVAGMVRHAHDQSPQRRRSVLR